MIPYFFAKFKIGIYVKGYNITGKKQNFRKLGSTRLEPRLNQNLFKNSLQRSETDHGGFQQKGPQQLAHRYEHMNS